MKFSQKIHLVTNELMNVEGSLGVPKTFTKKQKSILWNTAKNKKGEREEKNQA